MKFCFTFLLLVTVLTVRAIDVESSKPVPQTVAPSTNPPRKKFDPFAGDPERIQRANAVDLTRVECKLEAAPSPFSFQSAGNLTALPEIVLTLSVRNKGKRSFTLSFPTTQRYHLKLLNAAGKTVYNWADDKSFVDAVGLVMVNPGDRIAYRAKLTEEDLGQRLPAGTYRAEMTVVNYPELTAQATFVVRASE